MSEQSLPYHSDEECEWLELQAELANIEGYLRHLPIAGRSGSLELGQTPPSARAAIATGTCSTPDRSLHPQR
jgi:hypothetical protein